MEKELHDLMGYPGLKIFQNRDFLSFSTDSILLADFVQINPRCKNIMDFGTGFGPIPLFLSMKTKAKIIGIDTASEVIEYAKESILYNHLEDQISVMNLDILKAHEVITPSSQDIIVCNPPFFKVTNDKVLNQSVHKTRARHEVDLTLENLIVSAKRLLRTGGSLTFVHRVHRLEDIIIELVKHRFHIKRIRYVYPKVGKKALMVLIDARHNSSGGSLELLEPLYILNESGEYTDEVRDIFNRKRS